MEIVFLETGYGLDPNGFIVSDVSKDKIDKIYVPCIQETIERLREKFVQLHSVYVYGSVVRGDAVIPKSDLDILALFDGKLSSEELVEIKRLAGELSQKYHSLVRDVGIAVTFYDYTMDSTNYYENAFLRELCVCIYGEDLRNRFGPYKLTPDIAIRFNGDISESLTRTLKRLESASDDEFKKITQGFSRKLIRTYYSMVMVRSQIWTTKLQEQSEIFLRYFPQKKFTNLLLLKWIDEPLINREAVYELFKQEGEWASVHFINEANTVA